MNRCVFHNGEPVGPIAPFGMSVPVLILVIGWLAAPPTCPAGDPFLFAGPHPFFEETFNDYRGQLESLPRHFFVDWERGLTSHPFQGVNSGAFTSYTSDGDDHSFGIRERHPVDLRESRLFFRFINETGREIIGFEITYEVEAWFIGQRRNRIRLKYDIYPDRETAQGASGRNAFETDIFSTDNPSPESTPGVAVDGKQEAHRVTVSGSVNLPALPDGAGGFFAPLAHGASGYFRWQFSNADGDDGSLRSGLAIDHVRITPVFSAAWPEVRITEVMASNGSVAADEDGDFEDWIELYNRGSEPVSLAGWGLSDTAAQPFRWTFPEVTLEPEAFLLVWASGKDRRDPNGSLHANFGVSAEGEPLFLADASGRRVDEMPVTAIPRDLSYGRLSGQGDDWFYFDRPTPGMSNSSVGYIGILDPPTFDPPPGFYADAQDVTARHPDEQVTIHAVSTGGHPEKLRATPIQGDFNGDGWANLGAYFPATGLWSLRAPDGNALDRDLLWGFGGTEPVRGDYNGDGKDDLAVYHADTGRWYIRSVAGPVLAWGVPWGFPGAVPVPGDFDGDGRDDLTVFHADTGRWFVRSVNGTVIAWGAEWGFPGVEPVPGDFNGSGRNDLAVYHADTGRWYARSVAGNIIEWATTWGGPGAVPVPGDFDGDGRSDLAVYQKENMRWLILASGGNFPTSGISWGPAESTPVSGDFNGDGQHDLAVYHEPSARWYVRSIEDGILYWNVIWRRPFPEALSLSSRAADPDFYSLIPTHESGLPGYAGNIGWGWKPPLGRVAKAHVVEAVAAREGYLPSRPAIGTWFIGPEFTNRYAVDVISLVAVPDDFFGYARGIYVPGITFDQQGEGGNYTQRGSEWERPAHLEYFAGPAKTRAIAGSISTRIHGGVTRLLPQKSLRLYDSPAESVLNYPFFDERAYMRFPSLVLRNSGNDWQYGHGASMLRDAYLQRLVRHMDFEYQAYRPSVLFLNGEYWGLHNLRERIDPHYLASQFQLDPERIDLLSGNATAVAGTPNHYLDIMTRLREGDSSDPSAYRELEARMDTSSFQDYLLVQTFIANLDWPHHNIDFWRSQIHHAPPAPPGHDGRWRWILYDLDFGMPSEYVAWDMFAWLTRGDGPPVWSVELIRWLWQNDDFVRAFCTRYANHLNTTFLPGRAHALLDEMAAPIAGEIEEHYRRWGRGFTVAHWRQTLQTYRRFMTARPAQVWTHLIRHFGLGRTVTLEVGNLQPERGVVWVNGMPLDGARTPGVTGRPATWTGQYFSELPVTLQAVSEPGYRFSRWKEVEVDTPEITFYMAGDHAMTAVFEEAPPLHLLHYWSLNQSIATPTYSVGGAALSVNMTGDAHVLMGVGQGFASANSRLGEAAINHLRINQPLTATLHLEIPTTDYENIVVQYEIRRSAQGPGMHYVAYTIDGDHDHVVDAFLVEDDDPQVITLHLSRFPETADQYSLALRLAFLEGDGGRDGNVRIDNISVEGAPINRSGPRSVISEPVGAPPARLSGAYFTGAGTSDLAVYSPSSGTWHTLSLPEHQVVRQTPGGGGRIPLIGDFNGDGLDDLAVYDPVGATWQLMGLAGEIIAAEMNWGYPGVIPVAGDFDGDGRCDLAVFDPRNGHWFIRSVRGDVLAWNLPWGYRDTIPLTGDFDGDGRNDLAVYDPDTGRWYVRALAGAILEWGRPWGFPGATPLTADFNRDNRSDLGVYDSRSGGWFVLSREGKVLLWATPWGFPGTVPVPGDYDGDGWTDLAVYFPPASTWYIRQSRTGDMLQRSWGPASGISIRR